MRLRGAFRTALFVRASEHGCLLFVFTLFRFPSLYLLTEVVRGTVEIENKLP